MTEGKAQVGWKSRLDTLILHFALNRTTFGLGAISFLSSVEQSLLEAPSRFQRHLADTGSRRQLLRPFGGIQGRIRRPAT